MRALFPCSCRGGRGTAWSWPHCTCYQVHGLDSQVWQGHSDEGLLSTVSLQRLCRLGSRPMYNDVPYSRLDHVTQAQRGRAVRSRRCAARCISSRPSTDCACRRGVAPSCELVPSASPAFHTAQPAQSPATIPSLVPPFDTIHPRHVKPSRWLSGWVRDGVHPAGAPAQRSVRATTCQRRAVLSVQVTRRHESEYDANLSLPFHC